MVITVLLQLRDKRKGVLVVVQPGKEGGDELIAPLVFSKDHRLRITGMNVSAQASVMGTRQV